MAVTREEELLNSLANGVPSDITPITREEQYLSYIGGGSYSYPLEPITRKEALLKSIAEKGVSGGGGVTINNQNKTITENGTYTADSGYTGLGTVTVDVQASGGGDFCCETGTFTPASEITEIEFDFKDKRAYGYSDIFVVMAKGGFSYTDSGLVIYEASYIEGTSAYVSMIYAKGSTKYSYKTERRSAGKFGEMLTTINLSANGEACDGFKLAIPTKFPYNSGGCFFAAGMTYVYTFITT